MEQVAVNNRLMVSIVEECSYIFIERLTKSTLFFSTVKNSYFLYRSGQGLKEVFSGERTIKVNFNDAYLLSLGIEIVYNLFCRLTGRTHNDYDAISIGSSIIVEGMVPAYILPPCQEDQCKICSLLLLPGNKYQGFVPYLSDKAARGLSRGL